MPVAALWGPALASAHRVPKSSMETLALGPEAGSLVLSDQIAGCGGKTAGFSLESSKVNVCVCVCVCWYRLSIESH